jgi:hypothetical protein
MNDQMKAYQNGLKRPLKTNARTPAVISRTGYGDLRVSPRISTLKANGVPAAKARDRAEAMANYVSGYGAKGSATAEARQAAAMITRQNRKAKLLSAQDAASLVEFAYGDAFVNRSRESLASNGVIKAGKVSGQLLKRKYAADKFWAARSGKEPRMGLADRLGGNRMHDIVRTAGRWNGVAVNDR